SGCPAMRATPVTARAVAAHQRRVGGSLRTAQSAMPATTGALPMATTVPKATPARATPAKNATWYPAIAAAPTANQRRGVRRRCLHPRTSSPAAPIASRTAPTDRGDPSASPRACAVPVVPHRTAAPSNQTRARRSMAPYVTGSDDSLGQHGVRHPHEPGDVGAQHVVARSSVALGGGGATLVDALHDLGEALLGVLERPRVAGRVLLHLQGAGGDTAGVGGLAGSEQHSRLLEQVDRRRRGRHVGALGDCHDAVLDQLLGVFDVELVLGGTGEGHLRRDIPHTTAFDVLDASAPAAGVLGEALPLVLFHLEEQVEVEALRLVHVARRVRAGDHRRPHLGGLLDGVQGDVAGPRHHDPASVERLVAGGEHVLGVHHHPVSGRFLADGGAGQRQPLAGEDAGLEAVRYPLVLAEQVADLALADSDVPGGHVGVLAEIAVQLRHQRLAEAHDLAFALAFGIEVGAAFGAPDRQAGEGVLERLLEGEELDHPEIHRGVEAHPPLKGPSAELNSTRKPRLILTFPESSTHGIRKMICRSGSQIRSMMPLSRYSGCLIVTRSSDSSTSWTAWWNSASPGLRRRTRP